MLALLVAWRRAGGNLLDLNDDGKVDNPGAAIMNAAWPKIADAVHAPRTRDRSSISSTRCSACSRHPAGRPVQRLVPVLRSRDIDKLLKIRQPQPFANDYCGAGNLQRCQQAVWTAIAAAGQPTDQAAAHRQPGRLARQRDRHPGLSSFRACSTYHDELHQPPERDPAGDQLQPTPLSGLQPAGTTAGGLKLRTAGAASAAANSTSVTPAAPYKVADSPRVAATGPLRACPTGSSAIEPR